MQGWVTTTIVAVLAVLAGVAVLGPVGGAAAKASGRSKGFRYRGLSPEHLCGLCMQTGGKLTRELEAVHPTSTVMYGGRTHADGTYDSLRYARSETRVYEILETVCEEFKGAEAVATLDDGSVEFVNVNAGGEFSNVAVGAVKKDVPYNACYRILEEYEDNLVGYMHNSYDVELDIPAMLCESWARVCPVPSSAA